MTAINTQSETERAYRQAWESALVDVEALRAERDELRATIAAAGPGGSLDAPTRELLEALRAELDRQSSGKAAGPTPADMRNRATEALFAWREAGYPGTDRPEVEA